MPWADRSCLEHRRTTGGCGAMRCKVKLTRLYIRDLFWLTLVAGLSVGWWMANHRAMNHENACKLWAFDVAAAILKEKTGDIMSVTTNGVWIVHPDGASE